MSDTATMNATKQQVIDAAREHLKDKHPGGATLEVVPESVRQDREWWYVTVQPSIRPPKRFEYYEALAEAETELQKSEHLTVLFVPTIPESEASAD